MPKFPQRLRTPKPPAWRPLRRRFVGSRLAVVPDAPTALSGTPGDTQVSLTWTAPGGVGTPKAVQMPNTSGQGYSMTPTGLGAGNWTMCGWFKIHADVDGYVPFLSLDHATAGYIFLTTYSDGTTLRRETSANALNLGTMTVGNWFFGAMTWVSGGNDADYFMAAGGTSTTELPAYTATDPTIADDWTFWIGNNRFSNRGPISVAAVKLWTTALTKVEIDAEISTYDPVKTANLYAYYSFRNGPQTNDESGNGHTLTEGAAASSTDSSGPPLGDSSITDYVVQYKVV